MFVFNLICLTFLKFSSYFYCVKCSDVEYQIVTKKPMNNLTLSQGSKFIIKNKITQILPSVVHTITDSLKYFVVPLFCHHYRYKDIKEALIASYDQRYFIPKGTIITHNSEKFKLTDDVEIKLNSGSIEVDASTYIYTVGKSEIITSFEDGRQIQRIKRQLYDIPTIEDKKILLNILNGNVYIDDSSVHKSENFGLLRNLKTYSNTQHFYKVELVVFSCKDSEKDEILNSEDGAILLKNNIKDCLEQFYANLQVPLVFECKLSTTIKDDLNFDILNDFKVKVKKDSEPSKPETPIISEKSRTPLKPSKPLTDDKREVIHKKMSKTTITLIILLPIVFITLIAIIIVIYYRKKTNPFLI
ncbi:hypothetical protein EHP00_1456 [Ecytonucleospora hepatopenaei]|uniref:Uncharacterized protein n=1 Tax=Ecytonucleospora hepatopenaei TaxID=646526 RepID=A0A1W0E4J3_9MICR|nr:hypothetical protein EHP00_1456 [Ecytonucleospora hepatopenaei]